MRDAACDAALSVGPQDAAFVRWGRAEGAVVPPMRHVLCGRAPSFQAPQLSVRTRGGGGAFEAPDEASVRQGLAAPPTPPPPPPCAAVFFAQDLWAVDAGFAQDLLLSPQCLHWI